MGIFKSELTASKVIDRAGMMIGAWDGFSLNDYE